MSLAVGLILFAGGMALDFAELLGAARGADRVPVGATPARLALASLTAGATAAVLSPPAP